MRSQISDDVNAPKQSEAGGKGRAVVQIFGPPELDFLAVPIRSLL